jgi:mRNA interferase MazF
MGFVFFGPITNSKRENPFYVAITRKENITGVIMADQLGSLDDRSRKPTFIGKCPNELFVEVLARIEPIIFDSTRMTSFVYHLNPASE